MVLCAPRLPPAVSGSGVRCGRACWARVSAVPRPSWLGCRGVFFAFFFFFGVGCWVSLSRALWSLSPHPLSFGLGCWLFFFFVVCVCMFRCPLSRWAAVPGLVLPVLAGWYPCASLGVLSSVPSWGGGLAASGGVGGRFGGCGVFSRPPPFPPLLFFFGGVGGLPVPPSAFPGLAHALARIQCCLPGCCWRLRSVWPCSGPMGWVGYVHVGLGAPSCRVRSWICWLGGCARRLRVALG